MMRSRAMRARPGGRPNSSARRQVYGADEWPQPAAQVRRILLEAWEGGFSYCSLSDDDGQTWRESRRVKPRDGCWEPACIELKNGRVMMLMRTGMGGQYKSVSRDGGKPGAIRSPRRWSVRRPPCRSAVSPKLAISWRSGTTSRRQEPQPVDVRAIQGRG
jgi:hypothetical protein